MLSVSFPCRYMVDAADQEKIEASKNELHNLLDKPQLQGIPVSCCLGRAPCGGGGSTRPSPGLGYRARSQLGGRFRKDQNKALLGEGVLLQESTPGLGGVPRPGVQLRAGTFGVGAGHAERAGWDTKRASRAGIPWEEPIQDLAEHPRSWLPADLSF